MGTKEICSLCGRDIPEGTFNFHHLIPKAYDGKETIKLHYICHDKIHHTFSEKELSTYYHTIERIKQNEQIEKFIKWISKKPPNFYIKHKDTKERNKRRKR